jgi:6-bladed beta-propeller
MFEFLRKDLVLIALVAAVFLSLSYLIGSVSKGSPAAVEVQPAFLGGEGAPGTQTARGRVWREHAFERLTALSPAALTKPSILRVDDAGRIYVLDWADLRIKMFSPDGSLLRTVGEGKGAGAGAFVNPTSFSVGAAGELWVSDPLQRRLTRFDPDGKVRTTVPQSAVDRVAAVGDVLITMAPPRRTAFFEAYDSSGEHLKSFGELIEDQSENGIVLDGSIVGDGGQQEFIYGGRYVGVIARYSAGGERRFAVQTIDGTPPPKILGVGESQRIKPNGPLAVMSMSIVGDELYVLSGTRADGAGGAGRQVMDVYDKRDGHYRFSLKLPAACREAVVRADYLYTLGDDGVTVWRVRRSA